MKYRSPYANGSRNSSSGGTGDALLDRMRELGVSKHELERISGVDYSTICRICKGDRIGYLDTWVRVCDALGIELQELL